MILEILTRNYYERNGSFAGILDSGIGSFLHEFSKKVHVGVEDFCYAALGYLPLQGTLQNSGGLPELNLSGAEVYALQSALFLGNQRKIKSLCGVADPKKLPDLASCLGMKAKQVGSVKVKQQMEKDLSVAVDLLTVFYSKCNTPYIAYDGYMVTFLDFIRLFAKTPHAATFPKIKQAGALIEIVDDGSIRKPVIIGKKLYVPWKLSDDKLDELQKAAVERVLAPLNVISLKQKQLQLLPFLSYYGDRISEYHQLLAFSSALGFSYNDLMNIFGYQVPDLISVYLKTGLLVYVMGDFVYYAYYDPDEEAFSGLLGPENADCFTYGLDMKNIKPVITVEPGLLVNLQKTGIGG